MADVLPSSLSKVDPADAWKPWRPSSAIPWDQKWVAHLYRRAAFGPSTADTTRALADGFPKTLDRLLNGEPDATALLEVMTDTGRYFSSPAQIRVWWLSAMLESGHPLREKLTLFWHNHFATSYAKVSSTPLMFEQNLLLRKHALGKFRPFLLDMSKDAAMLVWLDSNRNTRRAPNENFAREVMELFSLGVGNYTEKDIQEAARAFTGWHVDTVQNCDDQVFSFKPDEHDDGPKTVFGKTGIWGGEDIVRFCCDRPSTARFLVGKLYAYLVSETLPPKGLLTPLEERFRGSDYNISDLVKGMLGSALFFSHHAYRKRVKWPVEYVLGAVRAVVPDRVPLADLADPLAKMGQVLFAPPNVKGWRTGTDWLNSATLLARNNFAETVSSGTWARTSARIVARGPVPPPPVVAVEEPLAGSAETPQQQAAVAAVGGAAVAYAPVREMVADDGTRTVVPVIEVVPAGPGGLAPLGAGGTPKPKDTPGAPPPPPDAKFDTVEMLFNPKPKTVAALIKRMGEVLYGEEIPAAARAKTEKFLLDGKKTFSEKDLDNPAFRQKVRETLHALMCLPEYQLC
jgi:uncharacterized protein (DUF1800 family)